MRFVWITALLLLAGCSSQEPSAPPGQPEPGPSDAPDPALPGPGSAAADPWSSSVWSFVDCRYRPVAVILPKPLIEDHVPPGYVLVSAFGDGVTVAAGIRQYECEALVVGNETVVSPINWAMTGLDADAENPPENATGVESYQFEWFIDNATAAKQLQARGFDAHHATISALETPDKVEMEIQVAGQTWYKASGVYGSSQAPEFTVDEVHYHGPDYLFALFETVASAGGLQPYTMTLEAEHGVFSEIGTGVFPATLWPGNAQITAHLPAVAG